MSTTAPQSIPQPNRRRTASDADVVADTADKPGPGRHNLHIAPAPSAANTRRIAASACSKMPRPDIRWLKIQLLAAADQLGVILEALNVVIIHDQQMGDLHVKYSGVEGTTDVLTFDLSDKPSKNLEGEIYICIDEAARQAATRRHDVQHELLLYALHGVLHLMGYDDHEPADHAAMHAEEDRVLQAIGVGRVFRK